MLMKTEDEDKTLVCLYHSSSWNYEMKEW